MQWILRRRGQSSRDLQSLALILLLTILFGLSACSDLQDNPAAQGGAAASGCASCHTDQELLMQLATEEPTEAGDAGEG